MQTNPYMYMWAHPVSEWKVPATQIQNNESSFYATFTNTKVQNGSVPNSTYFNPS